MSLTQVTCNDKFCTEIKTKYFNFRQTYNQYDFLRAKYESVEKYGGFLRILKKKVLDFNLGHIWPIAVNNYTTYAVPTYYD